MSKYPLIESLGLNLGPTLYTITKSNGEIERGPLYVLADDLEAALIKAPVVRSYSDKGAWQATWPAPQFSEDDGCTHTARLICIQPIQKDTAESLLREIVTNASNYTKNDVCVDIVLIARARVLLGEK